MQTSICGVSHPECENLSSWQANTHGHHVVQVWQGPLGPVTPNAEAASHLAREVLPSLSDLSVELQAVVTQAASKVQARLSEDAHVAALHSCKAMGQFQKGLFYGLQGSLLTAGGPRLCQPPPDLIQLPQQLQVWSNASDC